LRVVYQWVPGWPIPEQTVASWLLLHETEEMTRATPHNCSRHRMGDISSLSDDLSAFFGTFRRHCPQVVDRQISRYCVKPRAESGACRRTGGRARAHESRRNQESSVAV